MSFRIEEKLLIHNNQLLEFKEFLFKKKAKQHYPPRKVKSLYFENFRDEMYTDSLEGTVPRKKIRVRNYPNSENSSLYLEMKISSVEGRYKTSKKINQNKFSEIKNLGIYDNQYGACYPKIFVEYIREYYKFNDIRISIDKDISYTLFSGRKLGNDVNSIVELKTNPNKDRDDILNLFPFQRIRFSKYCNGYEKI